MYDPSDYEPGDLVSHTGHRKTIGIFIEYIDVPGALTTIECASVFWIQHPDVEKYGHYSLHPRKYIRAFKPWRGFYKQA